jgi:hypothetical protein
MDLSLSSWITRLLGAGLALLVSLDVARAADGPSSYVRPPATWHEIAPAESPLRFGDAASIRKIFVDDAWTSRYEVEVDFTDGGLVHYEKPRWAYSADISLKRVFYQVYGHDDVLAGHGIAAGIDDAVVTTIGERPVAYLARQGKDATCFAFVSQFAATPGGGRERMLNGSVCRPVGEGDADALARRWLALFAQVVVP